MSSEEFRGVRSGAGRVLRLGAPLAQRASGGAAGAPGWFLGEVRTSRWFSSSANGRGLAKVGWEGV